MSLVRKSGAFRYPNYRETAGSSTSVNAPLEIVGSVVQLAEDKAELTTSYLPFVTVDENGFVAASSGAGCPGVRVNFTNFTTFSGQTYFNNGELFLSVVLSPAAVTLAPGTYLFSILDTLIIGPDNNYIRVDGVNRMRIMRANVANNFSRNEIYCWVIDSFTTPVVVTLGGSWSGSINGRFDIIKIA